MFGLEKKFDQWISKKEDKWIRQRSDPYIPLILSDLNEVDPNWLQAYESYLDEDRKNDIESLSYIVDLTHPLVFTFRKFIYSILYEKEVHESAYENMHLAWKIGLTEACSGNKEVAKDINSNIYAYEAWDSIRTESSKTIKFLGIRSIPNLFIFSGYIIRHVEPYFSEMIETIDKDGLEANEKTQMCWWDAANLEKVLKGESEVTINSKPVPLIELLTFAYRGNRHVAQLVQDRVDWYFQQKTDQTENS